jgi:predicted dithiol-disulfide oxidoreductase (DUF899 family)
MFGPDWEEGCPGCSLLSDQVDGARQHFEHNDVSFVAVSRAPIDKLAAYRKRMGWTFRWVSSAGSDFNFDYHVSFRRDELTRGRVDYNYRTRPWSLSEAPGISVFLKENGRIYHTYSTYERGLDMLNVAYHYMDLVPKGRDEAEGEGAAWVRRRDEYED